MRPISIFGINVSADRFQRAAHFPLVQYHTWDGSSLNSMGNYHKKAGIKSEVCFEYIGEAISRRQKGQWRLFGEGVKTCFECDFDDSCRSGNKVDILGNTKAQANSIWKPSHLKCRAAAFFHSGISKRQCVQIGMC